MWKNWTVYNILLITYDSKKPGQTAVLYQDCGLSRLFWIRCYFNWFSKSCNKIFQNWSYLCIHILTYFKIQPTVQFFSTKKPFFLKKLVLGSDGNWLFWTHSWIRLWMICRPSGRSFQLLTCAVCTRAWAEKEVCNTFIRTNIPEIPVWGFKITYYILF